MAKGGARVRSGPPPDPTALHRDRDAGEWSRLPAAGCDLEPPAWPLPRPTKRERDVWAQLWRLPQAVMWHRNHQADRVAMYVRSKVEAETRGAAVSLRTLVRQEADGLGLTQPGMRALRWVIEGTADAAALDGAQQPRASARDRLRVVNGGG